MLSAMAPHGREMSQDLRKKIISLHKKGEGYKKISKALLISHNTVAKVVQTFKIDGTATISQRRPGRPLKLTPRQERLLMRRVEENRHASSLQLSKEVESHNWGDYFPWHNTAYPAEEWHAWVPCTKEARCYIKLSLVNILEMVFVFIEILFKILLFKGFQRVLIHAEHCIYDIYKFNKCWDVAFGRDLGHGQIFLFLSLADIYSFICPYITI